MGTLHLTLFCCFEAFVYLQAYVITFFSIRMCGLQCLIKKALRTWSGYNYHCRLLFLYKFWPFPSRENQVFLLFFSVNPNCPFFIGQLLPNKAVLPPLPPPGPCWSTWLQPTSALWAGRAGDGSPRDLNKVLHSRSFCDTICPFCPSFPYKWWWVTKRPEQSTSYR